MTNVPIHDFWAIYKAIRATGGDRTSSFRNAVKVTWPDHVDDWISNFPVHLDPNSDSELSKIYGDVIAQRIFESYETHEPSLPPGDFDLPDPHPIPLQADDHRQAFSEAFEETWRDLGRKIREENKPVVSAATPGTVPATPEDAAREVVDAFLNRRPMPPRLGMDPDPQDIDETTKRFEQAFDEAWKAAGEYILKKFTLAQYPI